MYVLTYLIGTDNIFYMSERYPQLYTKVVDEKVDCFCSVDYFTI